jgi:hypothetical protein
MTTVYESVVGAIQDKAKHPLFYPLVANALLLAAIGGCLLSLQSNVGRISSGLAGEEPFNRNSDDSSLMSSESSGIVLHSLEEAKEKQSAIKQRNAEDSALPDYPQKLAALLAELDQWLMRKDDIEAFQAYKITLAEELRSTIESSVSSLHSACLQSSDSATAQPLYGEASQLIALFPLADDPDVLKRASTLSTAHSLTAARLEAIRRQRYNLWALEKTGGVLLWLEKGASSWTTKDNPQVVTRASLELGAIDPALLEPAAMQLYTLAISKANEAISTAQQADLAKKLTNPATKSRRTLGDF